MGNWCMSDNLQAVAYPLAALAKFGASNFSGGYDRRLGTSIRYSSVYRALPYIAITGNSTTISMVIKLYGSPINLHLVVHT